MINGRSDCYQDEWLSGYKLSHICVESLISGTIGNSGKEDAEVMP